MIGHIHVLSETGKQHVMDTDKASLVTRVRSAQIKLLYENAALSTLMSLINAALVFFLLWEFC